jgi:hypothetical protein
MGSPSQQTVATASALTNQTTNLFIVAMNLDCSFGSRKDDQVNPPALLPTTKR